MEDSDLKVPGEDDVDVAAQSSPGTSPPKGDNEKYLDVTSILDCDLETFTTRFLENISSVVHGFLSWEFIHHIFEISIVDGEDPGLKLTSFLSKLHDYENKIPKDKVVEMERVVLLVNTMAYRFHDLKTQEESKNRLTEDIGNRINRLRHISTKSTPDKRDNEKEKLEVLQVRSYIQKLEEKLRKAFANRDALLNKISEWENRIRIDGETTVREVQSLLLGRQKLATTEDDLVKARLAFDE